MVERKEDSIRNSFHSTLSFIWLTIRFVYPYDGMIVNHIFIRFINYTWKFELEKEREKETKITPKWSKWPELGRPKAGSRNFYWDFLGKDLSQPQLLSQAIVRELDYGTASSQISNQMRCWHWRRRISLHQHLRIMSLKNM